MEKREQCASCSGQMESIQLQRWIMCKYMLHLFFFFHECASSSFHVYCDWECGCVCKCALLFIKIKAWANERILMTETRVKSSHQKLILLSTHCISYNPVTSSALLKPINSSTKSCVCWIIHTQSTHPAIVWHVNRNIFVFFSLSPSLSFSALRCPEKCRCNHLFNQRIK